MPACPLPPQRGLTLAEGGTDGILDAACAWRCQQRRDWPAAAAVWRCRQGWPEEKGRRRAELVAGTYAVGLLRRGTLQDGTAVDLWAARDALVMQALPLSPHLPLSPRCTHRTGHGGLTQAVRAVGAQLPQQRFVFKTEVRSYDASIDHPLRLDRLAVYSADRQVLTIIGQYLRRGAERGGGVLGDAAGPRPGQSVEPAPRRLVLD